MDSDSATNDHAAATASVNGNAGRRLLRETMSQEACRVPHCHRRLRDIALAGHGSSV